MSDRVTVDIQGGVADVRLVRADKMNALCLLYTSDAADE